MFYLRQNDFLKQSIDITTEKDEKSVLRLFEKLHLDAEAFERGQCLLIRKEEQVIAAVRVRIHADGTRELCSLGVYRTERGQGLAGALVKQVCENHAPHPIYLVTEIPMFFKPFGFETTVEYPESIQVKQQRCFDEFSCQKALVMCRKI